MNLAADHVARLQQFLTRIAGETYPECPSEVHSTISDGMLDRMFPVWNLSPGSAVLDVGCGQGLAMRRFLAHGLRATGITLNGHDVQACQTQGLHVEQMDQSFLDFTDATFDLVWCRHCLEHSVMPFFTLSEFRRVLKPGAWLYVEVPAPDTPAAHHTNANHYSVLGDAAWQQLIVRSGFVVADSLTIDFATPAGPDRYLAYNCRVQ